MSSDQKPEEQMPSEKVPTRRKPQVPQPQVSGTKKAGMEPGGMLESPNEASSRDSSPDGSPYTWFFNSKIKQETPN